MFMSWEAVPSILDTFVLPDHLPHVIVQSHALFHNGDMFALLSSHFLLEVSYHAPYRSTKISQVAQVHVGIVGKDFFSVWLVGRHRLRIGHLRQFDALAHGRNLLCLNEQ